MVVKTMVTTRDIKAAYGFFRNLKNWESGGALREIRKGDDGWWTGDSPFGKARIKLRDDEKFGILDHDFVGGGGEWTVYCRITPNGSGSTVSWLFVRPEQMTQEQFEGQLDNFDDEISGWKKALES